MPVPLGQLVTTVESVHRHRKVQVPPQRYDQGPPTRVPRQQRSPLFPGRPVMYQSAEQKECGWLIPTRTQTDDSKKTRIADRAGQARSSDASPDRVRQLSNASDP